MSIPADCVGADLDVHNTLDMCYAGYHYDLNFLTIHGKSRFPGLFVWLRNGRRVAVRIPAGCLFIQAGKQLEWLTAGFVKAGMHEVGSCLVMVSQLSHFMRISVFHFLRLESFHRLLRRRRLKLARFTSAAMYIDFDQAPEDCVCNQHRQKL